MAAHPFSVSVVIPCYNMAGLVSRAIASAVEQTLPPREVIVVDDGSRDHVRDVLTTWQARYPNLQVVHQENRGNAGAKNSGIQLARGNWIGFLDADDAWLPGKLQAQYALWSREPQLEWIAGSYQRVKRHGEGSYERCGGERIGSEVRSRGTGVYDALDLIAGETSIWIGTMLAQTAALRALGGFCEQLRGCDDSDLWVRFALRSPQLGFVTEPLASYTVAQAGSMTGQATRRIEPSQFLHYQRLLAAQAGADRHRACQIERIVHTKINGYFNGMLRTGNLQLAREFLSELRQRQLPLPTWYRRWAARLPETWWRAGLQGLQALRGGAAGAQGSEHAAS